MAEDSRSVWLGEIQGFLIDLDGVLFTGNASIPGGRETLEFLEDQGYVYRCISNSTRRTRISLSGKLQQMGYRLHPDCIQTPAMAAVQRLIREKKISCFLLSTGDVHKEFEDHGIMTRDPHADTVIVGDAGEAFTYEILTVAFRRLLAGGDLWALERDRYWKGEEGLMLSAGPFVQALEYASGNTSYLIGKPAKEFFLQAVENLHLEPGRVAMIGDDMSTDILGAQACGLRGILVRTGKYRKDAVLHSGICPDLILDSIADLPAHLPR